MNEQKIAHAAKYSKSNPPASLEDAEERVVELGNIIILLATQSKGARLSLFDSDSAFQNYLDERTGAIAACKMERAFLSGFIGQKQRERDHEQRMQDEHEERLEVAPAIARELEVLSEKAQTLLSGSFEIPPGGTSPFEQATARRKVLIDKKNEIISIFSVLKQIRNLHGGVPFPQRPRLKDMIYQIERELRIARRSEATTNYQDRCRKGGRPELDITLREAIQFLLNLLEKSPPDLSSDLMSQQTLDKIRAWATAN